MEVTDQRVLSAGPVTGTVTEVGVLHPDYRESVAVKLVD